MIVLSTLCAGEALLGLLLSWASEYHATLQLESALLMHVIRNYVGVLQQEEQTQEQPTEQYAVDQCILDFANLFREQTGMLYTHMCHTIYAIAYALTACCQ